MTDYSPYQRKIIDRYYKNLDAIKHQQLSELATELLPLGRQENRPALETRRGKPQEARVPRVANRHLLAKRDPALLVGILGELEGRPPEKP